MLLLVAIAVVDDMMLSVLVLSLLLLLALAIALSMQVVVVNNRRGLQFCLQQQVETKAPLNSALCLYLLLETKTGAPPVALEGF